MDKETKERVIRELARQQAFGVKKLTALGGSYALIIPPTWVRFHCVEIDGDYYFKMGVEGDTLILKAISDGDLEGITIKEKGEAPK